MKRWLITVVVTSTAVLGLTGPGTSQAKVPGPNGRIVFTRFDQSVGGVVSYTMNPDGTQRRQLFFSGHSEWPHWSPDGRQISIFCCDDGMAAHIVDVDSGGFRELAPVDPNTLEEHCGFAWSPDGQRLACGNFGLTDPRQTGVWTIRSSDGGGLIQITSNPGGEDNPGDFSPDEKRLVFARLDQDGQAIGIFVVRVNGTGLRQLTPPGMVVDGFGGSWSPTGDYILFVARADQDHHRAIWEVNADGSGLHKRREHCKNHPPASILVWAGQPPYDRCGDEGSSSARLNTCSHEARCGCGTVDLDLRAREVGACDAELGQTGT